MTPCTECGEYTRNYCRSCDEAVCTGCYDMLHDCDEEAGE